MPGKYSKLTASKDRYYTLERMFPVACQSREGHKQRRHALHWGSWPTRGLITRYSGCENSYQEA